MEQKREPIDEKEIEHAISKMRNRGTYPEEMYHLVREDMKLGISREETSLYTDRNYDVRQAKVCSNCLRRGFEREVIELICQKEFEAVQMETVFEIVDAGVPLENVKEIISKTNGVAHQMKKAFECYKRQVANKASEDKNTEHQGDKREKEKSEPPIPGYLKEIVDKLQEATAKLEKQEDNYKELSQKLNSIESAKEDASVIRNMEKEIAEKDELLVKQQEDIQKANSAVARLRKEKENMEQEMKTMKEKMQNQIDELSKKQEVLEEKNQKESGETPAETIVSSQAQNTYGIPVYYKVPVIDSSGQIVQRVQVERAVSKDRGIAGMFGRLAFRHKSRADIVKLVASGDLIPAQLVQIKIAIEKGLTENQIVELINNNVAAEKMKEIIEIAVLENCMN